MTLNFDFPVSIQILFVVLMGLTIGSFLNVVIFRLPRGRSVVRPSSRCGFCKSSIPTWMNLPLISFLCTGGTCARCGVAFSARYPIVEFLTMSLFLATWSVYGWGFPLVVYASFAAMLIAISFIDLDFRIIPDSLSLGGWFVAIMLSLLAPATYPMTFSEALWGSLIGSLAFWIMSRLYYFITHEEGLGGGDVKLMGFVGAVIGWKGVLTTILVGSLLGTGVGLAIMMIQKKSRRFPIPFGPFLAIGSLVSLFQIDDFWWKS